MIKNIIFDLGNVVFKWNQDEIVANFSDNLEEQEELKNKIFKSEEWLKLDEGIIDYNTAIEIFRKKTNETLGEKINYIMNTWYKFMPINNEVIELIKKLKQEGYRIYILSNTHVSVYNYIKTLEIVKYIDGMIISSIEKLMKPNKEIYSRLIKEYKLIPQECFFIDDGEKNVKTAIECGMNGYVFNINNFDGLINELIKNKIYISK